MKNKALIFTLTICIVVISTISLIAAKVCLTEKSTGTVYCTTFGGVECSQIDYRFDPNVWAFHSCALPVAPSGPEERLVGIFMGSVIKIYAEKQARLDYVGVLTINDRGR